MIILWGENMQNKNQGFKLSWVLIIVAVTSIVSALTTGVIVYNNNKITSKVTYTDLAKDPELNQFLEVYANIISEYYEDIDKEELLTKAIAGMMNYLGDDYSTYLDGEETSNLVDSLSGEYKGIGVSINNADKMITKVYANTPASEAGILEGDIIVSFNGEDVTNISTNELVEKIKTCTSAFTLRLKRNNEFVDTTLSSKTILSPSIDYKILDNNVGYLAITTFSKTLDIQVKNALKDMESNGITSLIIDMRDNTGGYLDAAEKVASMFLAKNEVIYSLNYKNNITSYKDETDEKRTYDIAIILNGNSASASEILAAALKESYGAKIVGEKSFGKGKVQQTMPLEDGSMIKYTSARWLTPNGTCIDNIGIIPDFPIKNEQILDEEGNILEIIDHQLEQAIEVLTNSN